jgi:hypothetical protein
MGLAVARDISLIWLILLTLITVLPFGVLFFYIIKGLRRLRFLAKMYMPIAQDKARLVADVTEQVSQKVAQPVIGAHAKAAQANGIKRAIFTRRKAA